MTEPEHMYPRHFYDDSEPERGGLQGHTPLGSHFEGASRRSRRPARRVSKRSVDKRSYEMAAELILLRESLPNALLALAEVTRNVGREIDDINKERVATSGRRMGPSDREQSEAYHKAAQEVAAFARQLRKKYGITSIG